MRPSDYDQEELLMMLQDTLMAVAAGQLKGQRCPVCERGELVCACDDGEVKLDCPHCGLHFEGLLADG